MSTVRRLLKNKIFRVCIVLGILTLPFTSKYKFIFTVGSSMSPTYKNKELIVIERRSSLGEDWFPSRGDAIVIKDRGEGEDLCKRVVGLPGDSVEIIEGIIFLNGKRLEDSMPNGKIGYHLEDGKDRPLLYISGPKMGEPVYKLISQQEIIIQEGDIWVIGDNKPISWFGLLPIKDIVGKILY